MAPYFMDEDFNRIKNLNEDMQQDGVLAAACLPLNLDEKSIGVMWLQYKQSHTFSPTEKRSVSYLFGTGGSSV